MRAEQAAYRLLLRVARKCDQNPKQLVTLLGWPSLVFDRRSNSVVRQSVANCPFVEDAIWEACGNSIEFSHPDAYAARAVRKHRHRLHALGIDYLPGAQLLLTRLMEACSSATRMFEAFAQAEALKLPQIELEFISGKTVVLKEELAERVEGKVRLAVSPRAMSADVTASSAADMPPILQSASAMPTLVQIAAADGFELVEGPDHEQSMQRLVPDNESPPTVGHFLIAHPISVIAQPCLDKSVMLLSEVQGGFAKAVVLNMAARGTLRSVLAAWSSRNGDGGLNRIEENELKFMESLEPLLDAPMLSGGNLLDQSLVESITWMHTLGNAVPGGVQVAPSVWLGGDVGVMAGLVASRQVQLERVRPIIGFVCWTLPQLELELKRGVWVRAHLGTPYVSQRLCMGILPEPTDIAAREKCRVSAWRASLLAAGVPSLADFPRGPAIDEMLRAIIHKHYTAMK